MKQTAKYRKIVRWLALPLLLSGCHFLEVDTIGKTTIPKLFSDMDGIRAALPGAYTKMFTYYNGEFYFYPDVAGDMLLMPNVNASGDMVDQYNYTSLGNQEIGAVGHIWTQVYEALGNVNNILQYEPSLREKYPEFADELKQIRAQALFLRAMCHFDLCRVYGQPYNYTPDATHLGVPIILRTPGANDSPARESVAKVYNQIIKDLTDARTFFGNAARVDAYHVSPVAIPAMLSRVYLYMERWNDVVTQATEVIGQMPLSQGDNYLAMFNDIYVTGDEAIFRFSGLDKSRKISKFYDASDAGVIPDDTLRTFFTDPDDIRLELLGGGTTCRKYLSTNAGVTESNTHNDPFVLRVSEMYLNRAEAWCNLGQLDKAADDIKTLQARALRKNKN
ncbi:MAG: RagB/SusD family nutrient uptake outer membrane protein, partial [Coprobacter sp.]|nr:RagB/SusD family nutrient uptake outer membrane protein [Coprobacter sp.]